MAETEVLEGNKFANVCVSFHRLQSLACPEYLNWVVGDEAKCLATPRLYDVLSQFFLLDRECLMHYPGVLIKIFSSLHLSAGGFCRADPSFRGRARYDNVSFFGVDGAVPVYDSATCGRLVCGLPIGQVFGPNVYVETQFAIVQRCRDSASPEHRRLARR
jgi:hypothetical protein